MSIVLIILAFLFLLVGLLGSVVPVIPGPPLSFIGLLLLQWSGRAVFSTTFLIIWAVITVVVTVMDYALPAYMTKKFGGSRMAVWGSVVGLIVGLFFSPFGLLVGPFLGALVGEVLNNQYKKQRSKITVVHVDNGETVSVEDDDTESNAAGNTRALIAALGAFLAFIVGTGAKLITGSLMIYYAIKALLS